MRFLLVSALLLAFAPALSAADVPPAKGYEAVAERLSSLVERELADKGLPAVSVALVDDQTVVWSRGFGFSDPKAKTPASADTVYRVGSVSKLFTDLAVMQLVESGDLDLDAPITNYLPDFKPDNPFGKAITLRQLMSHRSGLVREPPVGSYFDSTAPTLARTVESLGKTRLLLAPEAQTHYSNGGIALVGYTLEATRKRPFPAYLSEKVLRPLGMKRSAFAPEPALTRDLARATMWTYHGREFPAPTFELGEAPAGCMYSTVLDLGQFLSVLCAGGKGPGGVVVKPETLEKMWRPQFAAPGAKTGFGLGFQVGELEGRRRIGHGGAIYGFATELALLPEERLGVVVTASRDCANAVTTRIADDALRLLLARRQGKPLPDLLTTTPLPPERARQLAGHYRSGDKTLDLVEARGRLYAWPGRGGFRVQLRAAGDDLIVDDVLGFGQRVEVPGADRLKVRGDLYERVETPKPAAPPEKWLGLIGEYGWDHNTLYILEKDGKLYALIEWFFLYPLEERGDDVFAFPDHGLYPGETLRFTRAGDRAVRVEAAGVVFERRRLDGEDGRTFKIQPRRPLEELRKEAQAAQPPAERGEFGKPDLVELVKLDPTIKLDVRYATADNFLSAPLYPAAKAYLQRPAAEALVRAHRRLEKDGYGLLIHDGYRPWSVTKLFWEATPDHLRVFVADPAQGSRHNRGCAADVTLYDRKSGRPVAMTGGYDEMSDRSYPEYPGGTSLQRWHRDLLRRAMEAEGFTVYEAEWWHFDYRDWKKYPIGNWTFDEVERMGRAREGEKPGG